MPVGRWILGCASINEDYKMLIDSYYSRSSRLLSCPVPPLEEGSTFRQGHRPAANDARYEQQAAGQNEAEDWMDGAGLATDV